MGKAFAATLTEREIIWLMDKEYARTAEDVVWRRSRLGLRMSKAEIAELDTWMTNAGKDAGPMAKDEAPHIEAL
jgi:glycerol-3-phosphate dehydrogenase